MGVFLGKSKVNTYDLNIVNIYKYDFEDNLITKKLSNYENNYCTRIGEFAFHGCSMLTTINLPNCTTISSYAFQNCSQLATASFSNCTTIGNYAFYGCNQLITISFPNCTTIGSYAFQICSQLATISLPNCTTINDNAFNGCYRLLSLYLISVSQVPILGNSMFYLTPIGGYTEFTSRVYGSVYVPESLYNSFRTATNWSSIASRIVSV